MKRLLLVTLLSTSFISYVEAAPHSHGGRTHDHALPATGIQHRHGAGAVGQQSGSQVKRATPPQANVFKVKYVVDMSPYELREATGGGSSGRRVRGASSYWDVDDLKTYELGSLSTLPFNARPAYIRAVGDMQGFYTLKKLVEKHYSEGGIPGIKKHKAQSMKDIRSVCNGFGVRYQQIEKAHSVKKIASNACLTRAFGVLGFHDSGSVKAKVTQNVQKQMENKISEKFNNLLGGFLK